MAEAVPIGADHAGFQLKERLVKEFASPARWVVKIEETAPDA